ncbi:MAG: metal-dependent hydrolase, partial [Anaerolineae bacterium]|nr:metal-dependent hydrolase [Anaerolineae bacterium]
VTGQMPPILPLLGAVGGILPDTLDFKFVQFWENYDVEIDPGPQPNAEDIADKIVQAIDHVKAHGETLHLRANTIRLGADVWQSYSIEFLIDMNEIVVRIGPQLNTGGHVLPGRAGTQAQVGRRSVNSPLKVPYAEAYPVDIFQGPSFLFSPADGAVRVDFLDWHHRWTHSFFTAVLVGLIATLFTGLLANWSIAATAGLVTGLGYSLHIIQDQMGFMGCNLWWPLTTRRKPGFGWFHSVDALPNFITVWLSIWLILYNLDRHAPVSYIPGIPYLLCGVGSALAVILFNALRHRLPEKE